MEGTDLGPIRDAIRTARRVVAITGAGISAESGVPTFRGAGGLWRSHHPEELATPEAFRRDPRLVWEWYVWRRDLILDKEPNPGHLALVVLERRGTEVVVITQNVDGLHALAGSGRILELHGDLFAMKCSRCSHVAVDRTRGLPLDPLPACPECGALLRPGVVWFGESLDPAVLEGAVGALSACDVCIIAGTSAVVQPAASLFLVARRAGALTVEVNPEATPASSAVSHSIRGRAGEVLPALVGGIGDA